MFARKLRIDYTSSVTGESKPCPVQWIDNFAMRNFTNDAIFDDTLPLADGLLEVGDRVPIHLLQEKMHAWFRRKSYLDATHTLEITDLPRDAPTPHLHPIEGAGE